MYIFCHWSLFVLASFSFINAFISACGVGTYRVKTVYKNLIAQYYNENHINKMEKKNETTIVITITVKKAYSKQSKHRNSLYEKKRKIRKRAKKKQIFPISVKLFTSR